MVQTFDHLVDLGGILARVFVLSEFDDRDSVLEEFGLSHGVLTFSV